MHRRRGERWGGGDETSFEEFVGMMVRACWRAWGDAVMVMASIFVWVNSVYFAIKRVQKDVKGLVVLSGVVFGLLVGFDYVFMLMFGVVG